MKLGKIFFMLFNCPSQRLIGVQENEDKVGYNGYNEIF